MVLLTPRTLNYIIRVINLGQRIGCHPYSWNRSERRAEVTKSRLQYYSWILTASGSVMYFMFLLWKWYRMHFVEKGFHPFLSFTVIFFTFPIFFHLNIFLHLEELPAFWNSYLTYNQTFQERYIYDKVEPKKLAKILEFTVVYVYYAFWTDYFAYTTIVFIRPHGQEQVAALVSTEMWDPRRLALTALFYYYGLGYVINACLLIFTSFGFFFSMFQILQEFGKDSSQYTIHELQDPTHLIKVYRILGLLIKTLDRTYRVITGTAKIILVLLAIFCTYGGMRLHGFIAITLGTIGGSTSIFLAVIMTAWSGINSISTQALRVLVTRSRTYSNGRGNMELIRRQLRTLRPLEISVFGMYVIDKPLVLTVMKVICEQIIFLLNYSALALSVFSRIVFAQRCYKDNQLRKFEYNQLSKSMDWRELTGTTAAIGISLLIITAMILPSTYISIDPTWLFSSEILEEEQALDVILGKPPAGSVFTWSAAKSHCNLSTFPNSLAILIHTARGHFDLRSLIRRTWGSVKTHKSWQVFYIFLVANASLEEDSGIQQKLQEEHDRYQDFAMQTHFPDVYDLLLLKHLMGYDWVLQYCPQATFVVKADDDIVINVRRVIDFVEESADLSQNKIYCYPLSNVRPDRDPHHKWFVSKSYYKPDWFPTFCYGIGLGTTVNVIELLWRLKEDVLKEGVWLDDNNLLGLAPYRANQQLKYTEYRRQMIQFEFRYEDYFIWWIGGDRMNKARRMVYESNYTWFPFLYALTPHQNLTTELEVVWGLMKTGYQYRKRNKN